MIDSAPWKTGQWERKHNSLFRPGPRTELNACVGWNGGPANSERYVEGYFEAGNRLVQGLQDGRWGIDCIVYPLAMLYRHGIEISLKRLLAILIEMHREKVIEKPTHDLMTLWRRARRYLETEAVTNEDLDGAERTVHDIVEIDRSGQVFRYPLSIAGERHLGQTTLINVEVLAEGMNLLRGFLDLQSDRFEARLEYQREIVNAMEHDSH